MYIRKLFLFVMLIGLVIMAVFSYYIYKTVLEPNTAFENDQAVIFIPTGATFQQVKTQLQPLLKNVNSFVKVARKKGYTTNVKSGKYIIPKNKNNNDIVNILRSQNVPVKVSFNNQETLANLAGRISQQIEADSLSLLLAFTDTTFLAKNGFTLKEALVMYIPNTYEIFWDTSPEKFRNRMLKEYRRFWNEERQNKAKEQSLTPVQVSVLASIVQKETFQVSERNKIAGVYLNRLRINMLLQADPTVIFAIKERTNNYDTIIKRVLYRDLEINSPYNTYKYQGLPPGPITMPDVSSIEAVLNPEKHGYLYFVADTKKIGFHKFAQTLAQHNQNRTEYVRWINTQGIRR